MTYTSEENDCVRERERERERGELEAAETEVITPGKIVPYKHCLPGSNISMQTLFLADITQFQALSVTFVEY